MAGAGAKFQDEARKTSYLTHIVEFHNWLSKSAAIHGLALQLGIEPSTLAGAGLVSAGLVLLWSITGGLLCNLVGQLYPTYSSFRALEDFDQSEISFWLTYWVTYSTLGVCEGFFYPLVSWLPLYHLLRLALTAWLFMPTTRGAEVLYTWSVGPLLRRYRARVDAALSRSSMELEDWIPEPATSSPSFAEEFVAEELHRAAAEGFRKVVKTSLPLQKLAEEYRRPIMISRVGTPRSSTVRIEEIKVA